MITVNGVKRTLEQPLSVTEYLEKNQYVPVQVAIELNDQILARELYGSTILKEGDVMEIVSFMGGGSGRNEEMDRTEDKLILGGHEFTSRFILGSGKFSLDLVKACIEKAGTQIITLALRRANQGGLDVYKRQEKMLADFLEEKPVTVRCRTYLNSVDKICESLKNQGVKVEQAPYLPYAKRISGYNHILALDAFIQGKMVVQDVSSMLVAEIANPQKGDYVIDMCAAPGGKSLHIGDKMEGFGTVDARDISQYKVNLIEENIQRLNSINVQAKVQDATIFDVESECKADIVLADVPCSGYGVIGKKPEIKYRSTAQKEEELVILQRTILDKAAEYVKPRGVLVFSTCTIAKEENEENMMWFMNNHPFKLESIDEFIPEELHSETTGLGYLQMLPGVHGTDGFFIARFRRK